MADSGDKLKRILNGEEEIEEQSKDSAPTHNHPSADPHAPGSSMVLCVECGDQPGQLDCQSCAEVFCEVCFHAIHRTGARKNHQTRIVPNAPPLSSASNKRKEPEPEPQTLSQPDVVMEANPATSSSKSSFPFSLSPFSFSSSTTSASPSPTPPTGDAKGDKSQAAMFGDASEMDDSSGSEDEEKETRSNTGAYFMERAKYIPLRLDLNERKHLRLLEAALNVSEYTDKVDILSYNSKAKRIHAQLREICAILCGLVVASDYNAGQALIKSHDFCNFAEFFQEVFEIGRRYKIMNPERMRADYGKLVYLLQDSQFEDIQNLLQFDMVTPVKTVYRLLEKHGALEMLNDNAMNWATKEIIPESKSRTEIQQEIKNKEKAIEYLAKRYSKGQLTPDAIRTCLYSIGDNHSFLRTSRDNMDKMINYLKTYFRPDTYEEDYSLAIQYGVEGARLSHNHSRQYAYVLQSLSLWREVAHDMFKLWILAEEDLLFGSTYQLRDTGQGLNRVQHSPKISKEMHSILYKTQKKLGDWVGSSVIHLGDHNVPNAFMFIDKYTQVPRILNPIVSTIGKIDGLTKDPHMKRYIESSFGGTEALKKEILCDFFRHAFDGSGADNFFDAGSCIDGRLTSAWNWCSKIEKKRYFPVFLLTDFVGFDGKF